MTNQDIDDLLAFRGVTRAHFMPSASANIGFAVSGSELNAGRKLQLAR